MKNHLKYVDGFMLIVLLLWFSSTDFDQITSTSWMAGGAVAAYLIVNTVMRYRKDKSAKAEKAMQQPERIVKKNKKRKP